MKKKAIIIVGILILVGTITFSSYSYVKVKQWDSLILPMVKIENENSKISDNVQYVGDNLLNDNLVIL